MPQNVAKKRTKQRIMNVVLMVVFKKRCIIQKLGCVDQFCFVNTLLILRCK